LLFPEQTAASLADALRHFEAAALWRQLPAEAQRQWAENFSPDRFRLRLARLLERCWQRHGERLGRQAAAPPAASSPAGWLDSGDMGSGVMGSGGIGSGGIGGAYGPVPLA
jgi:hypothetical protein